MMDGCTLLEFKISTAIHCHYKVWKSQECFSDCIRLKEESHIQLGWLRGKQIIGLFSVLGELYL